MPVKTNTATQSPSWISRLADGVNSPGEQPGRIRSVSVIGAGVMGRGIAAANLQQGISVRISDTSNDALSGAVAELEANLDSRQQAQKLISGTQCRQELAASDLIIEAAVERLAVKQRIFAKLETYTSPESLFASNTSSIPITQIAAKLEHPERFVGLHFCHPVAERPLLEIVRGEQTSDATLSAAVEYARSLGKRPVVVGDSPGFVVNRLLTPYLNEATVLLLEGAKFEEIEAAAVEFGMPLGPLAAIDGIGIDVALRAGTVIYDAFPERMLPSGLLLALFERGDFGYKTKQGFYVYGDDGQPSKPSPAATAIIDERKQSPRPFSKEELTARLFLPMLTEAMRVLDEGLVTGPRDIDDALVYGIGFPVTDGGLLGWAERLGMTTILEMLAPFSPLGLRYQPTEQMRRMSSDGNSSFA